MADGRTLGMASTRRFKISSNQSQPFIFAANLAKRSTEGCAYSITGCILVSSTDKTAILSGLDKRVPSATCNFKWQCDGFSRCFSTRGYIERRRSKRLGILGLSAPSNSPTRSLSSSVQGKSSGQVQPRRSMNPTAHITHVRPC